MLSPLVRRMLTQMLAILLGPFVGWMVDQDFLPAAESAETVTKMAGYLAGILWMLYERYQGRLTFLAAKSLPANATGAQITARATAPEIKAKAFKSNTDPEQKP